MPKGAKSEPKGAKNGSKSRYFMLKTEKGSHEGPKCALRIDFVSKSDGKRACQNDAEI